MVGFLNCCRRGEKEEKSRREKKKKERNYGQIVFKLPQIFTNGLLPEDIGGSSNGSPVGLMEFLSFHDWLGGHCGLHLLLVDLEGTLKGLGPLDLDH